MKKSKLEKYIGERVRLYFRETDGTKQKIEGTLHKTREEIFKNDPNLMVPRNYYFLTNPQSFLFRSSHVEALEEI